MFFDVFCGHSPRENRYYKLAKSQLFPIRPPTSPTTLIGGLAFPTKGGKAAPTVVTRSPKDSFGGEFLPSISSSSSLTSP